MNHEGEIDFWKEKFGDNKKIFCEICLKTKLIKNKSSYGFSVDNENNEIKLECNSCFVKDMEMEIDTENNNEQELQNSFHYEDNINKYLMKVPYPYKTRDFIYGNTKKIGKCGLCDCKMKIRKDPGFSWYKKLPTEEEEGDFTMEIFDLVCEECFEYIRIQKKGIYQLREELKKIKIIN